MGRNIRSTARLRRVEVRWVDSDAPGDGAWVGLRDVRSKLGYCVSVGYLVYEDKDAIVLAQSLARSDSDEIDQYGHALKIPRVSLLEEPKELRR